MYQEPDWNPGTIVINDPHYVFQTGISKFDWDDTTGDIINHQK